MSILHKRSRKYSILETLKQEIIDLHNEMKGLCPKNCEPYSSIVLGYRYRIKKYNLVNREYTKSEQKRYSRLKKIRTIFRKNDVDLKQFCKNKDYVELLDSGIALLNYKMSNSTKILDAELIKEEQYKKYYRVILRCKQDGIGKRGILLVVKDRFYAFKYSANLDFTTVKYLNKIIRGKFKKLF